MNITILKSLLTIYENKRNLKIKEAENRKNKLYSEYPRFEEIDTEISSLSISASKNLIASNSFECLDTSRKQIEKLKTEKKNLLISITNDEDLLYSISNNCCFKQLHIFVL